jgi:neuronal PAS domain-containing protein 1/3
MMINNKEDKHGKPSYERAFCIRMKSTLTKRGCHFKSSGYRVVLLLGQLRPQYSYPHAKKCSTPIMGFIGLAIALPPPSVHEVRLETDMFVTRLAFDFKIAHCEPKVSDLLDYSADDLTGKSMYSLVHAGDVDKIKQTHVDLIKKGQVMSNYYRLMNRRGGYTWMQICATLVCNSKNSDEQSIICVNYVLSGSQYSSVVMDKEQVNQPSARVKLDEDADVRNGSPESVKDGEYSNQGSEGGRAQNLNLEQNLDSYSGVGGYGAEDPASLRLGQTPVEAPNPPNPGLSSETEQENSLRSPAVQTQEKSSLCENNEKTSIRPKTASPHASSPPSPSNRYSAELRQTPIPDQNSNSVRDLENAMSKHLPKDKVGEIPFPLSSSMEATQASQASHLLKQFYSRQALDRPGYLPDMEADSQFLNYARLAGTAYPPAQPVPLKPNVYSVNPPMGHTIEGSYTGTFDQSHIYSHSTSSFHLYNRGQSWYSGN